MVIDCNHVGDFITRSFWVLLFVMSNILLSIWSDGKDRESAFISLKHVQADVQAAKMIKK